MKLTALASALGVPALGLGVLLFGLFGLGRPQARLSLPGFVSDGQEAAYPLAPNPRVNGVMATFLRQEARRVARARAKVRPKGVAEAIDGYNLVARECTPEVFQKTGLPAQMTP